MTRNFGEVLAAIAARHEARYARVEDAASDAATLTSVVRRRRVVRYGTTTVLGAAATAALAFGVVQGWDALHVPPAVSPTGPTTSQTTDAASTRSPSPTPSETSSPTPSEGPVDNATLPALAQWRDAGADPSVFGLITIKDAVTFNGRVVVVGCTPGAAPPSGFPAWFAAGPTSWTRANGPGAGQTDGEPAASCLQDLVVTPFGLFAHGTSLYRSVDGVTWDQVVLDQANPGFVDSLFAVGGRLTVLTSHWSTAESTKATVNSTTDGVTWSASVAAPTFDNAEVDDVIATPTGLLAVGASPGGSFVPTAAAWTSADGLTWQRVTPEGGVFAGAFMYAVSTARTGYVAVGPVSGNSVRMAAFSSPDGLTWTRATTPAEQVGAGTGYLDPRALTRLGGTVYAAGLDSDSARPDGSSQRPALWSTTDGVTWQRIDAAALSVAVPFAVTELNGMLIGFSPAADWPGSAEPVDVLTATR